MFGIRPSSSIKKASKVTKNVFAFSELQNLDCNIYLLKHDLSDNDYELMLIDAGNALNSTNLLQGMVNIGLEPKKIKKIIITHEHLDHILGIYNIPELAELSGSEFEILALGKTMEAIKNADEKIIAPKALGINTAVFGVELKKLDVIELKDKEIVNFGNFKLDILYTPGHSLGSLSIYEKNFKILFPGDVVFCGGSFGRVDFPGGSMNQLKDSIRKIMEYDVKYLCPGHMYFSEKGNEEIKKSLRVINSYY